MASSTAAAADIKKVGFVWSERYAWHNSAWDSTNPVVEPKLSGESPAGKRRCYNLVCGVSDLPLTMIEPRLATDEEILRYHTPRYLEAAKKVSQQKGGGWLGHELFMGEGGFEIASLSLGGVLRAVEKVMAGELDAAYCLVRPPGHHADADGGHGYCCFSNVSLAAAHALAKLGASRVAILDWDVHHGNSSEDHFYKSKEVLFFSLHQDKLYPLHTGGVECSGEGEGKGYNINLPLPPGSGWGAYEAAFQRVILPGLRAFKPDLILVSSGFDSSFLDPLGRMMLTSANYKAMTEMLLTAGREWGCKGVVAAHEGGYSELYSPFCCLAVVEGMFCGSSEPVLAKDKLTGKFIMDPFIDDVGSPAYQGLLPHQEAVIEQARAVLSIALLPESASAAAGTGK